MARKILVDGVDLAPANVDFRTFTPSDSDLGQQISQFSFEVDEEKQITPKIPREHHEVQVYDDDGTTLISGGFIRDIEQRPMPIRRRWAVFCQDYNIRAFETATGLLNKTGQIDSDRNWVIAIFRDALKAQTFGVGTGLDDAIITANEPNWPGVQTTAFVSGLDWSYMSPKNAMDNLMKYVPGVQWRIGPDKVLTYGRLNTLAPFIVSTSPGATNVKPFEDYFEEIIVGAQRNKMRRGGAAASEATAFDEVSYARSGRILADPYVADTTIPAADITRRAYAELRTRGIRRRVRLRVRDKGLQAGQLLDVVNNRTGSGTSPWPWLNVQHSLAGRAVTGPIAGERGRFLITKVATHLTSPATYVYDVEAGDYVQDLASVVAGLVNSGA
jgi:hypothetical protein